jgi:hypothetical protein
LDAIKVRGEEVSAEVRLKYEDRIAALAQQVDLEAQANPEPVVGRLATEFRVKANTLLAEHERVGGSWGDLMIAHTLRSNVRFAINASQIFDLHTEGMSWTMVAHGLSLDVDRFVAAVESEHRVALGESAADGKVPVIGPATAAKTSVNTE